MLRLDALVAAIAERAISSYDYVHAAISTYPAFFCMNFDIRAVGFPFNSVYADFPELFGEKKVGTNCYFAFVSFIFKWYLFYDA